jgi:hypothetical protein
VLLTSNTTRPTGAARLDSVTAVSEIVTITGEAPRRAGAASGVTIASAPSNATAVVVFRERLFIRRSEDHSDVKPRFDD